MTTQGITTFNVALKPGVDWETARAAIEAYGVQITFDSEKTGVISITGDVRFTEIVETLNDVLSIEPNCSLEADGSGSRGMYIGLRRNDR